MNLPLLAVLTQMLSTDANAVAECFASLVLGQRAQIDQLVDQRDQLQRRLDRLNRPPSKTPPRSRTVTSVWLIRASADSDNKQLMVLGKSHRPTGAHRQPLDHGDSATTLAPPQPYRHNLEPSATVPPLPTQRASDTEESPPVAMSANAGATGTETGAPARTSAPSPTASTASATTPPTNAPTPPARKTDLADTAAPPAGNRAHAPLWIRRQIGIRVLLLWFIAIAVGIDRLVGPLCGVSLT